MRTHHFLILSLATAAALAAPAAGAPAAQSPPAAPVAATTLDPDAFGGPQLGAGADGAAVVAWVGQEHLKRAGHDVSLTAIFAAARPAGGGFGAQRLISTHGVDASRAFALAVGRGGDAAVVWRPQGSRLSLRVSRRLPRRAFGVPAVIPGSRGGHQVAAAIDAHGRLLVAWLAPSGRKGCGSVVLAIVAPRGGRFGTARRVSGACPNAALVRAALAPSGAGAVAWRAGRNAGYTRSTYAIEAAGFSGGRFAAAKRVSTGPAAGSALTVAGDGDGALVVWRDQASVTRAGALGRVLAAAVAGTRIGSPSPVSVNDRIAGPIDVATNAGGAAIVTWEQGRPGSKISVWSALRDRSGGAFGAPEQAAPCGATDASRTGPHAALDGAGGAVVAFQAACGGDLGLGPDYAIAAATRPAAGPWGAPFALSSGGAAADVRVARGDAGETIAAWRESGTSRGLRVAVLAPGA
jgi:hypothetical protein